MRSLLKSIFISNWPRKCLSLILALVIWLVVNQSMTATKTINGIAVRIVNIPAGKTIEGLQSNGILNRRVSLTVTGNKTLLEDLNSNDLEVVIDAANKQGEWIATITKTNLFAINTDVNLPQGISKVSHKNFIIKLTKLVTEKIPIIITQPIGEAPKGYQYIDVWPYQLHITISGPEEVVKKLKTRGLKLTFNLNDISRAKLDDIRSHSEQKTEDVVSFFVPNHWKQISLPVLSNSPIEINDPNSRFLRIDFIRKELLPLKNSIPIGIFFPPQFLGMVNPQKAHIGVGKLVEMRYGQKMVTKQLYCKGVSELFLEIVRDNFQIMITASPHINQNQNLEVSVIFINPRSDENRYVSTLMSDASDEDIRDMQPQIREEYLRNRFRNYMNRFALFTEDDKPFRLDTKMQGTAIIVSESQNDK